MWFAAKSGIFLGILLAVYLLVNNYHNTIEDLANARAASAASQTAVAVQKQTIDSLEQVNNNWQTANTKAMDTIARISKAAEESRADEDKLDRTLDKHNLDALAKAHPGMVQDIVNSGSLNALQLLRCASDASCDYKGDNGRSAPAGTGAPTARAH